MRISNTVKKVTNKKTTAPFGKKTKKETFLKPKLKLDKDIPVKESKKIPLNEKKESLQNAIANKPKEINTKRKNTVKAVTSGKVLLKKATPPPSNKTKTSPNEIKTESKEVGTEKLEATKIKKDKQKVKKKGSAGGGGKKTNTDPQKDPGFLDAIKATEDAKNQQTTHAPAKDKKSETEAASELNEQAQGVKNDQVGHMGSMESTAKGRPEITPSTFLDLFKSSLSELEAQMPTDEDSAKQFKKDKPISKLQNDIDNNVNAEKEKVAGPILTDSKTEKAPESNAPTITPGIVPPQPEIPTPTPINTQAAIPKKKQNHEISMEKESASMDTLMQENKVSDAQLEKSNEPAFIDALGQKKTAKKKAKEAPVNYRAKEQSKLSETEGGMQAEGVAGFMDMMATNAKTGADIETKQNTTSTASQEAKARINAELNTKYTNTKTKVTTILEGLSTEVETKMDLGLTMAKTLFESRVEAGLDDIYGWFTLDDAIFGEDTEAINALFNKEKAIFKRAVDKVLHEIATIISTKLNEALTEIENGRKDIETYFSNLSEEDQKLGQEAFEAFNENFDELEDSVYSKQEELAESLADSYKTAVDELQESFDKIKEEVSATWIGGAINAIKGVIDTIIKLKEIVTSLLSAISQVIDVILEDPIQFVSNLFSGIAQGFKNFVTNIKKHLIGGFVRWLTGAMGGTGIVIPENIFSLSGMFQLLLSVLGIDKAYVRKKAVKLLGEGVVTTLESAYEGFKIIKEKGIIGIWEMLKEKFQDLKESLIGEIQNLLIVKVIEAGVKWLLSLLIPGAGFIKAIMAIKDVIVFFVESAMMLIPAITEAILGLARGNMSMVAKAIEKGLSFTISLVINLFAKLIGLGGLAKKVTKIFKKIRKRVDKAIDKLIKKAKKKFKSLAKNAKKGAKKLAGKLIKWWTAKKKFKGADGKKHTLFFSGEGNSAVLTVASNPTPFKSFISSVKVGNDKKKKSAKTQAMAIATKIDSKKKEKLSGKTEEEKNKSRAEKQTALKGLLGDLSVHAKLLFGVSEEELPVTIKKNESVSKGGDIMGTKMISEPLTKKGSGGSVPTGRKHKVFDKLLLRRKGGSSYYIRGHLLNHNMHGPGAWENMTPLSKTGNSSHETQVESKVKAAVSSGAIVKYEVVPKYSRGALNIPDSADPKIKQIREAEQYVPIHLACSAYIMEKKEDGNYKEKQKIVKLNVKNPIETGISSYQLDSEKKENVSLSKDDADKISKNTGINKLYISMIKSKINDITSLNFYDQLKVKFEGQEVIIKHIEDLRGMSNVTLN